MDLKKCINCGDLFAAAKGQKICPNCLAEEENKFQRVKDYLWDNPGATISQVSEATDVGEAIIKKFVREGRLKEVQGSNMTVECQRCGKEISEGKYCDECSTEIANGIQKTKQKKKSKEKKKERKSKDRMFTRDRD